MNFLARAKGRMVNWMKFRAGGARGGRRAYALAMVVILLMVASVLIAVMLDRANNHRLTVKRQLQQYVEEQVGRGMREAVEAWLAFQRGEDLREALDVDGRGFSIQIDSGGVAEGQRVDIYFRDAQGTILAELAGLQQESFKIAREALIALRQENGRDWKRFTRPEGPVAVSVRTASRESLTAIVDACLDGMGVPGFVDEMISARGGEVSGFSDMTQEDFARLVNNSGLPPEAQSRLMMALTIAPSLWWVEARSVSRDPDKPALRFGGYAIIARQGQARPATSVRRASMLLTWERLPEE